MYPRLGQSPRRFCPVCRHGVFPDTAQQHVRPYPHAGIGADFRLFSADIRLSLHSYTVCRRLGGGRVPCGIVLLVQELPAGAAYGKPFPCFRIHRAGQPAVASTHAVRPCFLDGSLQLPVTPAQEFSCLIDRMERTLLVFVGTCFLLRTNGDILPSLPGIGVFRTCRVRFRTVEQATLGYLLILFIASSAHCLAVGSKGKIRTRNYLQFLILLNFCIFVCIGLQPALAIHLMSFLFIGVGILAGHLFVLTNSRNSNQFFICALVGLFVLFGFNVWTLL